ncbi:hypothetical protein KEM52_005450 [Ascosphaera acerosa]|nr:hypothetical protein KEM52_005450 [Ascosphaera acerosa]
MWLYENAPTEVRGPASLPPAPPYAAPAPPAAGFTRTLAADEVVVCPNCEHELGVEGQDPVQSQVWVVKQCGHVYCGLCAQNRKSRSRNGSGTRARRADVATKAFSKCVVDDCGKSTVRALDGPFIAYSV